LPVRDYTTASGVLVDESFQIGPFAVSDVDRNWNGHSFGPFHIKSKVAGYAFQFGGRGATLQAWCSTQARDPSFSDGFVNWRLHGRLGCTCADGAGRASLVLEGSATDHYVGTLRTTAAAYRVQSIHNETLRTPTGYRLDRVADQSAQGAVDVMGPGHVWLNRSIEPRERAELSCIAAGLMLYRPPQ
jgi:hypothetical protein